METAVRTPAVISPHGGQVVGNATLLIHASRLQTVESTVGRASAPGFTLAAYRPYRAASHACPAILQIVRPLAGESCGWLRCCRVGNLAGVAGCRPAPAQPRIQCIGRHAQQLGDRALVQFQGLVFVDFFGLVV